MRQHFRSRVIDFLWAMAWLVAASCMVAFALTGCSAIGDLRDPYNDGFKKDPDSVSAHKWPKFPCRKEVKETIEVSGTFDGKGCEYVWTGKYADKCDAPEEFSESVPKMFVLKPGATLKNVGIRCSPDGVALADNSRMENVWIHAEEDGANTASKNITLKKVRFYFASDKALQMNPGTGNLTCDECEFYHSRVPIKYDGTGRLKVLNSKFYNVQRSIRGTKGEGTIEVRDSTFENARCVFGDDSKAKVEKSGLVLKNVMQEKCAE